MSKRKNITDYDLENLEDLKILTKRCKQKWYEELFISELGGTDLDIDTNLLTESCPRDFVLCISVNPFVFKANMERVLGFSLACAWHQHGVLNGIIWDNEKAKKLEKKFKLLVEDLRGDNSIDLDVDLKTLGYDNLSLPRTLPQEDGSDYEDDNNNEEDEDLKNEKDTYIRVSTRLVEKNITGMIVEIAKLIANYTWNRFECMDIWHFPRNKEMGKKWRDREYKKGNLNYYR